MSLLSPPEPHHARTPNPRRRGGRRPAGSAPKERRLHVEAAYWLVVDGAPPDAVARRCRVSRRTVYRCPGRALRYTEDQLHADDWTGELASMAREIRRELLARA